MNLHKHSYSRAYAKVPSVSSYACAHANEQVGRLPGQPKKEEKVDQAPLDVSR